MKTDDAVFDLIRDAMAMAIGEKEAWTLQGLADYCTCPRRQVEEVIEKRLEDFGFVIVSGTSGLWRPLDAEEVNRYQNSLQSRLRKLAIRKRSIRRLALKSGFVAEGKSFRNPPARQGELFAAFGVPCQ
jgi:hypothetical protein